MKRTVTIAAAIALPVLLMGAGGDAGCSATTKGAAVEVAQISFDAACANLSTASVVIESKAASGAINGRDARRAREALAVMKATCDSPPVNRTAALRVVLNALATVAAIEAQAAM